MFVCSPRWGIICLESHVRGHYTSVGRRTSGTTSPALPRQASQEQYEQRQQPRTGQRLPATSSLSPIRTATTAGVGHPLTTRRRCFVPAFFSVQWREVLGRSREWNTAPRILSSHRQFGVRQNNLRRLWPFINSSLLAATVGYYWFTVGFCDLGKCLNYNVRFRAFLNEWMNTYIYIAPVKQKSSEALAAE